MTDRSQRMDERSWWDLWNTSYRAEDNRDQTSTELFAHVVDMLNQVTQHRNSKILEVACGTGTLSRHLTFSSYQGLDISAAAVEIARQKSDRIQWPLETNQPIYETADFSEWPCTPESFDVVLCVDSISSFRDQQATLHKMSLGLRPGGSLLLTTANPFVYNRIRRVGGVRLENGPVSHWHTGRELEQLIKQAGLKVTRSYTIMPRGNMGILRVINTRRLNQAFGQKCAAMLKQLKERVGLGQYRVMVAVKEGLR
jgi:2-polyprenyl-3-methyl-5-hydroxy-6-metoxy-1,4-benzoquinol methylase